MGHSKFGSEVLSNKLESLCVRVDAPHSSDSLYYVTSLNVAGHKFYEGLRVIKDPFARRSRSVFINFFNTQLPVWTHIKRPTALARQACYIYFCLFAMCFLGTDFHTEAWFLNEAYFYCPPFMQVIKTVHASHEWESFISQCWEQRLFLYWETKFLAKKNDCLSRSVKPKKIKLKKDEFCLWKKFYHEKSSKIRSKTGKMFESIFEGKFIIKINEEKKMNYETKKYSVAYGS